MITFHLFITHNKTSTVQKSEYTPFDLHSSTTACPAAFRMAPETPGDYTVKMVNTDHFTRQKRNQLRPWRIQSCENRNCHYEKARTSPEFKSRLVLVLLTMAWVVSFVMSPQNTLTLICPIIVSVFWPVHKRFMVKHRFLTNIIPCTCKAYISYRKCL